MKLVIDIPEDVYNWVVCQGMLGYANAFVIAKAISNGIILPKSHGRLIDADRLLRPNMVRMYYHLKNGDIAMPIVDIEHAETLIPADKEGD